MPAWNFYQRADAFVDGKRYCRMNFGLILIISLLLNAFLTILWKMYINRSSTASNFPTWLQEERINTSKFNKPQYHLSHLIVPLHEKQLDALLKNLQTWEKYLPCDLMNPQKNSTVTLVFYFSGLKDPRKEYALMEAFSKNRAKRCFGQTLVRFAGLRGGKDSYLQGSRLMFEGLLTDSINIKPASYIFYMEPDCYPIRAHWLDRLESAVVWPNPPFWVKGSIYHGDTTGPSFNLTTRNIYDMVHVNGNAFYNLWDPNFHDWYFNQVRPFIQTYYWKKPCAYDTDTFKLLFFVPAIPESRHLLHNFHFTHVIKNYWHTNYSIDAIRLHNPGTVLVHGKQVSSTNGFSSKKK